MFAICRFHKINLFLPKISRCNFATELTYQVPPFKLHQIDCEQSPVATVTKQEALRYYEWMKTIRDLENASNALYKAREIRGFCHLYSGQEAVGVGVKAALKDDDNVITSYRGHAWCYLMSKNKEPLNKIFCELLGKEGGNVRGKGGSMHLYATNFFGGCAIVGAQVPLGVGIAFASMYQKLDEVCVAVYGDGAANNGQVFEAFNMAKLWNVPCVFLCENNLYAMGTSVPRSAANPNFYTKGETVPGIQMDGMDVLACREAMQIARNHCSAGKGPIILEALTYRYYGHSLSDPGTTYRTHQEVKSVREEKDCINKFKRLIITANLCTEKELKDIDKKIKAAVNKARTIARSDKEVKLEELTCDIYANEVINEVRGVSPLQPQWKHKNLKVLPPI